MADRVKVKVSNFKGLDAAAKARVSEALNTALKRELKKVGGAGSTAGIFGDGSVKGMPAGSIRTRGGTR